jgi:hypothetical protein
MALIRKITLLTLVLGLILATAGALAAAEKAEFINGNHWTKWPQADKLVYIRGLTNWADFIVAAQSQKGNTGEYCMSKVLVDALKTKTLGQIVSDVDAYYQKNSDKMSNPVIEAILRGATKICTPSAKEMKK